MLERAMGSLKDRYLFLAILLLAGIIAFPITTTNLWAVVCFAAFIIHDRFNNLAQGVKNSAISKLIVVYFFLIIVTALRESTLAHSLAIVVKRILIILPLFFYGLNITAEDERKILSAYVLSVTVACIISFFNTLADLHLINNFYEFSWQLSKHSVFPSNYLAVYTAFAIMVMFYFFFKKLLFNTFFSVVLFAILMIFITVLGSRTAFFSMALICCGYLLIQSLKKRRHIIYSFIMLAGLLLLVATVPYFKSRVMVLFTVGFEADARYYEYLAAKEIFAENFLLGVGYSGSDAAFVREYERIGFHDGVANSYNAHNQFVQGAILYGTIGFIIMLALYIAMLLNAIRQRKFLPIAFCVLFTLCSLTECLLERNKGIVFFGFFTGLLLVAETREKHKEV